MKIRELALKPQSRQELTLTVDFLSHFLITCLFVRLWENTTLTEEGVLAVALLDSRHTGLLLHTSCTHIPACFNYGDTHLAFI